LLLQFFPKIYVNFQKISCDVPALFSKACEYFILEVTLRAWMHTQSCTRETIRRCDIFQAVKNSGTYDFLIDRVPFGPHCVTHQVSSFSQSYSWNQKNYVFMC